MRFSNDYGFCEINSFPGCAQLAVSNNRFIHKTLRGKGFGSFNHKKTLQRMKDLGYDAAICTVRASNEAERKILSRHGWLKCGGFTNRVNDNYVEVWFINF